MPVPSFITLVVTVVILFFCRNASAFGCLDHEKKFVDWWVMYKSSGSHEYVYYDSELFDNGLKNIGLSSSTLINAENSPLVNTIRSSNFPYFQDHNRCFLAWNDQMPGKKSKLSDRGHAKGFLGLNFNQNDHSVESFLIQHSLPRFPLLDSREYFDKNIDKLAQHFVCVSMKDRHINNLKNVNNFDSHNFTKIIFKYLSHIRAPILFRDLYLNSEFNNNNNHFATIVKELLQVKSKTKKDINIPEINSFSITSTLMGENQLKFQIIAKSPDSPLDIYDDVTSLLSIHHADYNDNIDRSSNIKPSKSMLMICQSHIDPSLLGINHKLLVSQPDSNANVSILNSSSVKLPRLPDDSSDADIFLQPSMHMDHSKWSITLPYGTSGPFIAKICFYDLNRTTKQTKRGGAAFCLNTSITGSTGASHAIWSMFLAFKPVPTNMARFNNANIDSVLHQIIPMVDASIETTNFQPDLKVDTETGTGISNRKRSLSEISSSVLNSIKNIDLNNMSSPIFSPPSNSACSIHSMTLRSRSMSLSSYNSSSSSANAIKRVRSGDTSIPNSEVFGNGELPSLEFEYGKNDKFIVKFLGKSESLPCPYKFNTERSKINKPLHCHAQAAIQKAIDNSGIEEINKFLQAHGLKIIKFSDTSNPKPQIIGTPNQKTSSQLFTPSTLYVVDDQKNRNLNQETGPNENIYRLISTSSKTGFDENGLQINDLYSDYDETNSLRDIDTQNDSCIPIPINEENSPTLEVRRILF